MAKNNGKKWVKKPKPGSRADSAMARSEAWKKNRNFAMRSAWKAENACPKHRSLGWGGFPRGTNQERAAFYASREWKELRFKAFMAYGNKCSCCGASPAQGGVVLHVDHVYPRSTHPEMELKLSNLQVLCADCNIGKSNKFMADFR